MNKPFTKIAAILFAIGFLAHLVRLLTHFSIQIAGYSLPLWVSILGILITGTFAAMLWKESR